MVALKCKVGIQKTPGYHTLYTNDARVIHYYFVNNATHDLLNNYREQCQGFVRKENEIHYKSVRVSIIL